MQSLVNSLNVYPPDKSFVYSQMIIKQQEKQQKKSVTNYISKCE